MADVANMLQKGCRRGCTACGRLWCPPYSTFACDQPSSWLSSTDSTTPTFFQKNVSLHFSYMFPTFSHHFSHIFSPHCSDLRPGAVWNSSWPRRLTRRIHCEQGWFFMGIFWGLLWMGQRNPNHQLKTVVNIPLFIRFQPSRISQPSTVVQCDDGATTIGMNMFFHRNTILLLNNIITNEL